MKTTSIDPPENPELTLEGAAAKLVENQAKPVGAKINTMNPETHTAARLNTGLDDKQRAGAVRIRSDWS